MTAPTPSNMPTPSKYPNVIRRMAMVPVVVVVAIVLFILAFGSFYTVDQGNRAVLLRNGRLIGVSEPGLHMKAPFIDSIVDISTRQISFAPTGRFEVYSYDQQLATLRMSVTYHVPEAQVAKVYTDYGSVDALQTRVIQPRTFDTMKTVFGQYTAISAIQDRAKLRVDALASIRASLQDAPLNVDGVQIEDISFSKAYEDSIENRMKAEVEIQTKQQNLATEKINAQIKVTQATANADAQRAAFQAQADGTRLQAEADARAIEIKGAAEAKAILARANALANNTNLVNLNAVERWNGQLPASMIPGATLPFLNVK